MKKIKFIVVLFTVAVALLLQSCVKDKIKTTQFFYEPVYKTKAEVLQSITAKGPQALKLTGKFFKYSHYLFVNEVNSGVHIIDNANPAAPVNKHFISIPGNLDLAVKGNMLYVDIYTEMLAIDISDPEVPVVRKTFSNVFPERHYSNSFTPEADKYIVNWTKHEATTTADIEAGNDLIRRGVWLAEGDVFKANAAYSSAAAAVTGISGSMARFTTVGNYLYTVGQSSLTVFNISNPEDPQLIHTQQIGWNIETIYPLKDKLFIGSQTGMQIFSIENPEAPVQLGSFSHACYNDPVVANDTHAFVTLRAISGQGSCWFGTPQNNEMEVVDITSITNPTLVKEYEMEEPKGLCLDGNLLFLCDGKGGLKLYDISDVSNIHLITKVTGVSPSDVIAYNNIALVVADEGIYQYDYSDVNNIRLISKISTE